MFKNWNLFFFSYFMEVIHIELPNKRGKFAVLKIFGKYLFHKFVLIFDNEAIAFISPLHNTAISLILQYFIGFHDKI